MTNKNKIKRPLKVLKKLKMVDRLYARAEIYETIAANLYNTNLKQGSDSYESVELTDLDLRIKNIEDRKQNEEFYHAIRTMSSSWAGKLKRRELTKEEFETCLSKTARDFEEYIPKFKRDGNEYLEDYIGYLKLIQEVTLGHLVTPYGLYVESTRYLGHRRITNNEFQEHLNLMEQKNPSHSLICKSNDSRNY